jgi:hypothetical protein
MKKLVVLCTWLALVAAACGGGDGDPTVRAPDEPGATDETSETAEPGTTPDVPEAEDDGINRPREGDYLYAYETETVNSATPNATPRRSKPDAELTSTVSNTGDETTTKDKSTEGSAVSTTVQQWEDDRVLDVESRLDSEQGSSGCEYEPPIDALHIPIKMEKFPAQKLEGKGVSCAGDRTITVEDQETIKDARGIEWATWRIRVETVVKQQALTKKSVDTRWFSPDLGKDVRIRGVAEYINSEGQVALRASQSSVLKTYPTA